jgi:hypothetical protein
VLTDRVEPAAALGGTRDRVREPPDGPTNDPVDDGRDDDDEQDAQRRPDDVVDRARQGPVASRIEDPAARPARGRPAGIDQIGGRSHLQEHTDHDA